jgi:hypothetical protein
MEVGQGNGAALFSLEVVLFDNCVRNLFDLPVSYLQQLRGHKDRLHISKPMTQEMFVADVESYLHGQAGHGDHPDR